MTLTRRAVLWGAAPLAVITLVGCGAAPAVEPAPSTPQPTASATGVTLAGMGFTHAPAGFTLPAGVVVLRRIDQPNVVTLTFSPTDGAAVLTHLAAQLPAMGFVVDASGNDSLVFHDDQWEGAFTISAELSGLTLRRRPAK